MLKADRRHAGGGSLGRWIIAHVRARWFWRLTRMSAYNNPCLCHIRNQTAPEAFSFVAWRKLCGRKLHDIFRSRRGDKLASWRSWLWNCDALHMLKADRLNTSTACRPERQCDAFHMLLVICLDFLHFSTSSAHAHTHAHVLCIAVSAGVRLVSAKEPY